jgi:hypothetical protein
MPDQAYLELLGAGRVLLRPDEGPVDATATNMASIWTAKSRLTLKNNSSRST